MRRLVALSLLLTYLGSMAVPAFCAVECVEAIAVSATMDRVPCGEGVSAATEINSISAKALGGIPDCAYGACCTIPTTTLAQPRLTIATPHYLAEVQATQLTAMQSAEGIAPPIPPPNS